MCVLSMEVPKRKKSGNLFNDPRMIRFAEDIEVVASIRKHINSINKFNSFSLLTNSQHINPFDRVLSKVCYDIQVLDY